MPKRPCNVHGCSRDRAHPRQFCEIHLATLPKNATFKDSKNRIPRCNYHERTQARCTRPAANPVTEGLCSLHHPIYKRRRAQTVEQIASQAKDPMSVLKATGHAMEKCPGQTPSTDKADHAEDMARIMEEAGLTKAFAARMLKECIEAAVPVKDRQGRHVRDEDGNYVYETDLQLRKETLVAFKTQLGFANDAVTSSEGGVNIHVGIHVPEKKPLPIEAEIIDVDDSKDQL